MKRAVLIAGAACLVVALFVFLRRTATYEHEVEGFERTVRARIDPRALQSWATNLLTRYGTSNVVDSELASYQVKDLPSDLRNLSKLYPSAFLFANRSPERAFIRVTWGSGFRGHWGLHIGATNFVDPYPEALAWKPGIYFWREHRAK